MSEDIKKQIDIFMGFLNEAVKLPYIQHLISILKSDLFQFYVSVTNEAVKEVNLDDPVKFMFMMDDLIGKFDTIIEKHKRTKIIMHYEANRLEEEK